MSDVSTVFTATEVAREAGVSAAYIVRLAKQMNLIDDHMVRLSHRGCYLFSDEAKTKIIGVIGGR